MHHVYGRAKHLESYKESYKSQLFLCRACHELYRPLLFPTGDSEQELVLEKANNTPINKDFKHDTD